MDPLRAALILLLVPLSICASHASSDQDLQRCVISKRTKGEFTAAKVPVTLALGEVVLVLKEHGDNSEVQRPKGAPVLVDSALDSKILYGRLKVPRTSYACANEFRPLANWDGQSSLEIFTHSADSGVEYLLKKDGTFKAVYLSSSPASQSTAHGRLHMFKNIIWARSSKKGTSQFNDWNVFVLEPSGELCYLLDGPGNEECK